MLTNPFKPTAGKTPPLLIDRRAIIEDFREGIEDGPGAPARLMRITGARGSGKTVLLNALGNVARDYGWDVIEETAGFGLCERILEQLNSLDSISKATVRASLGIVAADVELSPNHPSSLRGSLTRRVRTLTEHGVGLLITIDEAQDTDEDEMRVIAQAVQHLVREDLSVALVFAGITSGVMRIIDGKAMTFLRRAIPEELHPIPISEVASALRETIESAGMSISEPELQRMAQASEGYPYMIQLVGYRVFRLARRHEERAPSVQQEDVRQGIIEARNEFEAAVIEASLSSLSRVPMQLLIAMSEDDGPSSIAEVAGRLGKTTQGLSTARHELISEQIIEPASRGYLQFSIPYLREYLRNHARDLLERYGL